MASAGYRWSPERKLNGKGEGNEAPNRVVYATGEEREFPTCAYRLLGTDKHTPWIRLLTLFEVRDDTEEA